MSDMYAVTAAVILTTPEGQIARQIPTFFLSKKVQGIVNEAHARKIAESILNPLDNPQIELDICVGEI